MLLTVLFSLPAPAQDAAAPVPPPAAPAVDELFDRLQHPGVDAEEVEARIVDIWSRSGSPSMDLLLQRGNEAMAAQDFDGAIGFYSALVDHAPGFAQGYSARSNAYFAAGLIGPALADIESALALEPRHFEAMTGLAVILEQISGPEEALDVWRMLAAITPYDPTVTEAIGRLTQQGEGRTL